MARRIWLDTTGSGEPETFRIVSRSDVLALLAIEWVCEVCGESFRGGAASRHVLDMRGWR